MYLTNKKLSTTPATSYGLHRLTRKILTDFPQVWVLFATLVAQSTPQLIADKRCATLKINIVNK